MRSIDRAHDMMQIPFWLLPVPAVDYMKYLGRKSFCGETVLTAFAHYAELIEGCGISEGYQADHEARQFFFDAIVKPWGKPWFERLGIKDGAEHFQQMPAALEPR